MKICPALEAAHSRPPSPSLAMGPGALDPWWGCIVSSPVACAGKYLEIFARQNNLRNYWVSIGNEVTPASKH